METNGESIREERLKIYKEATESILRQLKDIQKTFSTGSPKDKKDLELSLANVSANLKKQLNTNVGDIYIFKTKKYVKYLENYFIPQNYEVIFTYRLNFFKVLVDSGFINNEEAGNLFNNLVQIRKRQIGDQWGAKKKISIPPNFLEFEYFGQFNEILEGIFKEEQEKIAKMQPELEKAWKEFSVLFNKIDFPSMGLHNVRLAMYGSSQNAFKTAGSDIDFTLLTGCYIDERLLLKIIKEYFDEFIKEKLIEIKVEKTDNNTVRIPHLQFKYKSFEFDLTVNNIFGVVNTRLLDAYAALDARCQKLGVLVKIWAKNNGICNGQDFLSSYCYIILVIAFLQNLKEPILPCLQKIVDPVITPIKRVLDNDTQDIQEVNFAFEEDTLKAKRSIRGFRNEDLSLAKLFLLFVIWLEELTKSNEDTISIKNGCLLPREETYQSVTGDMNKNPNNFVLSVEDPFDKTHDLGKNFRKNNNVKMSSNGKDSNKSEENRERFVGVLKETRQLVQKYCEGNLTQIQLSKVFRKNSL